MTFAGAAANLLMIFGITFLVWRKQDSDLQPFFWPAIFVKLAAGIGLGLVYKYYYPVGDTFNLFNQSAELTAKLYENPSSYASLLWDGGSAEYKGYLRSAFFVKILSVINILTYSNYWITGLWLSMITFLSSWHLFKVINSLFANARIAAAFALLFFPTAVFWSAGIIKESLALAGLFMLASLWVKIMKGKKVSVAAIIFALISLWIVWHLKYYWAAVFIPIAFASAIVRRSLETNGFRKWSVAFWAILVVVLCLAATLLHPNFHPHYFLSVLLQNHDAFVTLSASNNLIHYYNLTPSWTSVLLNAPWALFSGLFRPILGENFHGLALAASLENVAILTLAVSALWQKGWRHSPDRLLIFSVLAYTFILCVFLALSTPNFGSLARYKSGFMPFFAFLICYRNPLLERVLLPFKKLKSI